MFGVFFTIFVVMALASILGEIVMRVRLTQRETAREKLAWWRRGGDEIAATYEELFPHSHVPVFRCFAFWLFLASCTCVLVALLWKSN